MSNDDDRPFDDDHQPFDDGRKPPPGPDELRAIVARSGRHHRRAAAVGMAATLVVGGVAGYLIDRRSTAPATTVAVTGAPSTISGAISGPVPLGGVSGGDGTVTFGSSGYTALFTRTAGPVTIRGFLTGFPASLPGPAQSPGCQPVAPPAFQAELSTAKMVGDAQGYGTADRTKPVSALTTTVVGQAEGDPTAVVVAAAGAGVTKIRVAFTGGATDEMAPAHGWVTLAAGIAGLPASVTTPLGTLTALNASGKVLSTQSVTMRSGGMHLGAGCAQACASLSTVAPPTSAPNATATTGPPATRPPATTANTAPSAPPAGACAAAPYAGPSQPAPSPPAPSPPLPTQVPATSGPAPSPPTPPSPPTTVPGR